MDEKTIADTQTLNDEQLNEVSGGMYFYHAPDGRTYAYQSSNWDIAFWCKWHGCAVTYVKGSEPKRFYCKYCDRDFDMDHLHRRVELGYWREVR